MTNPRPGMSPVVMAVIAIIVVGALGLIIMFALNVGLFSPAASPGSRASGVPSSAGASRPPTGSASTAPIPSGSTAPPTGQVGSPLPTAAGSFTPDEAFLAHVPDAIRATCTLEGSVGSVVRTANCSADGGALVVAYSEYDTPESLTATFTDLRLGAQIEPDTGSCEDARTWPAEGVYLVDGEIVGRRLCLDGRTGPTLLWTDTRLNILAQVVGQPDGHQRVVTFWTNEAGPQL